MIRTRSPGGNILRKCYREHSNRYATSYCVMEVFSVFKRKLARKRITESQYIKYLRDFIQTVIGANLLIDEVPILTPGVFSEAERMIKSYKIDFIDCFQIVTILHGRFHVFGPNSKSVLITADRKLAEAARTEGARVWECTTEPTPA